MCACGRRRGTVGAAVRRHGGNARQEGRRINGKGGAARKERHGKERRHGGRPRQRIPTDRDRTHVLSTRVGG